MPSVRVLTTPEVTRRITNRQMDMLFEELRNVVGPRLGYTAEDVEVLWIPIKRADNAAPLSVEVMYSVKPDHCPNERERAALGDELAEMVAGFGWLPDKVDEIASWILPQHDAVFKTAKREVRFEP